MKKKFLAIAMAAAMAFSTVSALPVNTTVAQAADAETLTGTGWWAAGSVDSRWYELNGDGSITINAEYTEGEGGAFNVEVRGPIEGAKDGYGYITTGSLKDCWYADCAGDEIVPDKGTPDAPVVGHKYKITVERSGANFILTYFDETENTEYCKFTANNTNMPNGVFVHFKAQIGTFVVSCDANAAEPVVTPVPTEAPQNGADKPMTDFSKVSTQPALKYTFDSADEVKLFGDAEVKDGVLNLAKDSTTNGVTYAQIDDMTSIDFSQGVTLTADVNVKDYKNDWTPIFMIGDGTVGGEGKDATALYHLSQGFSSVGGLNGNYFEGYFGNGISSPYTWDYFSKEENRGKWYTISVTITPTKMTTYINGQEVQTLDGDYANVLQGFKVGKNNYLGVSYWPGDPDFAGSLDNVAIYNTALSAEDMGKLSTGEKVDIGGNTVPDGTKKQIMLSSVSAKLGAKKVTGTVNAPDATVKVQVNKAAAVTATVKDKKFTANLKSKLKAGDKVKITVTAEGYYEKDQTVTVKGTMKVSKVTAKKGAKTITGTVSEKKATVKIKVGKKAYKKAKVSGKKFTLKVAALKKGTKVTVKATKKNYKTATKSVKVK